MSFSKYSRILPQLGEVPFLPSLSLVAQTVKHLYTMWEIWVRSLGQEDPLEKEMATHSSILAWKIQWQEACSVLRLGSPPGEGIGYPLQYSWASLVTQLVKYLPAM